MVYLKDLIFSALYQWKRILVFAIIFAMLLGGWKGISTYRDTNAQTDADTTAQMQEALALYTAEKDALNLKIETLNNNLQNQQDYLDNSLLMQLNPYLFYRATLTIYVDTGYQLLPDGLQSPDKTGTVLEAYSKALMDAQFLRSVAESLSTEPVYLNELISVEILPESALLTVYMDLPTADAADSVITALVQHTEKSNASVADALLPHTVRILEKNVSAEIDLTLAQTQQTAASRIKDLSKELSETQVQLDSLTPPSVQTNTASSAIIKAVLFAVVGAVAGGMLTVFVAWVAHIISNKIYSARTLQDRVCLTFLGGIDTHTDRNPIDRYLRKAEGRNVANAAEQTVFLAADIRNRVGKQHLLVTGCAEDSARELLVQALTSAGLQVTDCGNILHQPEAVNMLCETDAVVLVEKCGISDYASVLKEVEMIGIYNKTLVGCILLNG